MVHGKNRIPYWIDRRLNGLAGPEYHAIISFGLPIEPEDSQYGEYRLPHIFHINSAGRAVISNIGDRCSRISGHSGYHECWPGRERLL